MDSLQASQQTSVEPLDTDENALGKAADSANMAEGNASVEQQESVSTENENNSASQQHSSNSPSGPSSMANQDNEMQQEGEPDSNVADSLDLSTQPTVSDDPQTLPNESTEEPPLKKARQEGVNMPSINSASSTPSLSQATQQQQPQYYRVSGQIVEPGRIKVFTDPTITQLLGLPSSSFIIPTGNFASPLIPNSSVSILLPASQLQLYSRAAVEESQAAATEPSKTNLVTDSTGSSSAEHNAAATLAGGHAGDRSRAPKIVFKPGMEHTISTPMSQAELSRRLLQQQNQPPQIPTTQSNVSQTAASTKESKRGSKRERDASLAKQQFGKPTKTEPNRKLSNQAPAQPSAATRDAIRRLASGASLYIQPAAAATQPRPPSAAAVNAQFKKPTSVTSASSRANTKAARQSVGAGSVYSQQQYGTSAAAQQQRSQQQYPSAAGTNIHSPSSQYQQQMMTPAADILCKLNARDIHAVTVQELFDIERRCVSGFKYVNLKQLNGAFVSNSVTGFQNPFMMRQKLQALSRMILNLQPLLIHADLGATLTPPLPLPTPTAVDSAPADIDAAAVEQTTENADATEQPSVTAEAGNGDSTKVNQQHTAATTEAESPIAGATASANPSDAMDPQSLNKILPNSSTTPVTTVKSQPADVAPPAAAAVTAEDPNSPKAVPALWTAQLTDRLLQACQIFRGDLESIYNDLKRDTEQRHSEAIKQQLIQHGSPFMTALLRGEDVRKYVLKPIGMYDVSVATSNIVRTPSNTAASAAYQQQQQLLQLQQQQLQQQQQKQAASALSAPKPHGNSREAREKKAAELRAQQQMATTASAGAASDANAALRRQQQQQLQHQQFLQNFPHQPATAARGAPATSGSGKTKKHQEAPPSARRIASSANDQQQQQQQHEQTSVWTSAQDFLQSAGRTDLKTSPTHRGGVGSRGGASYGSNLLAAAQATAVPVVTAVTKSGRNVAKPKRFQDNAAADQTGGEKSKANGGLHHMAAAAALSGGYRSRV